MPRARNQSRPLILRIAATVGMALARLGGRLARRPLDSSALFLATAVSGFIVVNALFLQSGARRAPFIATTPRASAHSESRSPAPLSPSSPAPSAAAAASQPATAPGDDPIAVLISMSSRIMAVQRVLSNYGYGQIKPTGVLDAPTRAAIEKFERDHNLPVSGRMSDRLVHELAAMVGHPLD